MNTIESRKLELQTCRPEPTLDMDTINRFWDKVLTEYEDKALQISSEPESTPYAGMAVHKITFRGYDETPVNAWHITPAGFRTSAKPIPCVVIFPGYTGDRGYPERYARWLLMGYAVLAVDVRGQSGETGNLLPLESGVSKGWITQGIRNKEQSYYMAIAMDAVRAVETATVLPGNDPSRIAVAGASQGGGLSLLAAALSRHVAAVVADIPNLCRIDYGVLNSTSSLTEVAEYIKRYPDELQPILDNLAYFDIVNLAHRIKAPVLMSAGWKDTVCMPEAIYAAYNRIQAPKTIMDYPFSGHEVSEYQMRQADLFLQGYLSS